MALDRVALHVWGPESSGTRLIAKIMIAAGAHGDAGHDQELDYRDPPEDESVIVWRRSFPHARKMPDGYRELRRTIDLGFENRVIICTRDAHAMTRSQVERGHVPNVSAGYKRLAQVYARIFGIVTVAGARHTVVSYENLVARPVPATCVLAEWAGLFESGFEAPFEIYDGNEKWHE